MVDIEWRHLGFWWHRTDWRARVWPVTCAGHGAFQVEVLWARVGSGFMLNIEGMILLLAQRSRLADHVT